MLHLLTGPDRVELSQRLMEQICAEARRGQEGLVLIVPEQFSHEAERKLCRLGGAKISRYAEVLSLSRLTGRVASMQGGAARAYLDKGGQLLAMALAAEQIASRIKLYAAVIRKPEFLEDMVRIVEEFQSYCLMPETLLDASKQAQGQFSQKLEELGLLYESYLAVCANGRADPSGKLLWLRDALLEGEWARERSFFVDGFSDFTGAELAVLEALLQQSRGVWIALSADPTGASVTRTACDTAKALRDAVEQRGIACDTCYQNVKAERNPDVQTLLDGLFSAEDPVEHRAEVVRLSVGASVEEECRQAAVEIKRLMAGGTRCRDIAVACTDLPLYEAALRASLLRANVPAYFAGDTEILSKPILGGVLFALNAAVGAMDYDDVALYLKSELVPLERDSCDRLDDYAYRWNIRGSQWEHDWEFHPRGFGESWTEEDRTRLEKLNQFRRQALEPLLTFRRGIRVARTTGEMVMSFHQFLEDVSLRDRLEQQANIRAAAGNRQDAQELAQLYEILRQSLEQMWLILGETSRSAEDFAKLYRTLLTQYQVGSIPAGLDQVHVSGLPDLRQKTAEHLLVLGASDGSFPAYKTSEGLLTEEERRQLLQQGISLAPSRAEQMDQEMSRIYSALLAAEQSIWLSYAGDQPAWLFRRAAALYPASLHQTQGEVFLDVPSLAAWRIRHGDDSELALLGLEQMEKTLRQLCSYEFTPLGEETVRRLYGRQIYLSASRIDKYAACRFAFFLAYGLKAQPRRQAQMDPSAFGTFVHAVLQETVQRVKDEGGFRQISQERLLEIATEEINAYVQEHFPRQAERAAYLFRRSQSEILDIVLDLGEELRGSLFQPESCELEFSYDGALPPIEVEGEKASCKISGFVDRVDLYETDDRCYVRVVDYKTGQKDFDYTDILNGAGLQMLIYLFALRQFGGAYFQKASLTPAGVLYLPARKIYSLTEPMPADQVVQEKHREERRRKGLILRDQTMLAAMELDPENPKYMPYHVDKNGPVGNLADEWQMAMLERHVLRTLADMTDSIVSGDVKPNPIFRGSDSSCRFCDYKTVCHGDLCARSSRIMAATSAKEFWMKLEQEEAHNG